MDKYALIITIHDVTPCNTASDFSWKQKRGHRQRWEKIIFGYTLGQRPTNPLPFAKITVTRHTPGTAPDYDNLVSSNKWIIDPMIKCGIILDDKPSVIGRVDAHWRRCRSGKKHTTIYVRECESWELDTSPWEWELA